MNTEELKQLLKDEPEITISGFEDEKRMFISIDVISYLNRVGEYSLVDQHERFVIRHKLGHPNNKNAYDAYEPLYASMFSRELYDPSVSDILSIIANLRQI